MRPTALKTQQQVTITLQRACYFFFTNGLCAYLYLLIYIYFCVFLPLWKTHMQPRSDSTERRRPSFMLPEQNEKLKTRTNEHPPKNMNKRKERRESKKKHGSFSFPVLFLVRMHSIHASYHSHHINPSGSVFTVGFSPFHCAVFRSNTNVPKYNSSTTTKGEGVHVQEDQKQPTEHKHK